MKFVTIADLNRDLVNSLSKIPQDIDLIVGIPRSGMLVACMISLYINLPLTDIDSFISGNIYKVGHTKNTSRIKPFNQIKKILVVEDSIDSGNSINEAKQKLQFYSEEVLYLAAYIRTTMIDSVNIYFRIIDDSRVFEWNIFHHKILENSCLDIDGVLCEDPSEWENDDGEKYRSFILNANPKFIPTVKVGWLVSSRLEKYRSETEVWLSKNNIQYNHLILMQGISAEERKKLGNHAEFKAKEYRKLRQAILFVESSAKQANDISRITGKSVFCVENHIFYQNGIYGKINEKSIDTLKYIARRVLPVKLRNKLKDVLNRS